MSANIIEAEPGDARLLRKQINESWAIVYHNLGRNEHRPLSDDEFLRTHLANYYHRKISEPVPTDDDHLARFMAASYITLEEPSAFLLRDQFTRRRLTVKEEGRQPLTAAALQEYATDLRGSAETYYKLSTPAKSGYSDTEKVALERLGRLRGYGAGPMALALYRNEGNSKTRAAFLDA